MSSALTDLLPHPIVQAPMAGGVSVPQLAAAVSEAGGLGFLAAGYKTADGMYQEIKQLRSLTQRPFGVNLFMPQPEHPGASTGSTGAAGAAPSNAAAADVYAHQLAGEAAWYETELGDRDSGRDDGYDAKLAVLLDNPVPVVSFHFGVPGADVLESLRRAGTFTLATATTPDEALAVERAGADAVIAQGVEAGGHQGTHRDNPEAECAGLGVLTLVSQIRETVTIPVVAAGGIMRGSQIAALLAVGATAAQLGTAFLATHESGANAVHKQALTNPLFTRTELTRAFTGRPARSLVNRFLREHGPYAPAAYPEVHHLTAPLRKKAAASGDAQGMALWAGQGHRQARELPAGRLVEVLAAELEAASTALSAHPKGPSR
ncbi:MULTISPECIES: nitronate monooxygenase [Streptomyces]|uniref:nitronate monooxygenase n=1 Tax=Streptomyces TaxID=1883 RepID=UPI000E1D546D|nr:nitronate monooxygenase [Streptomyces sp. M7]RDS61528.1 nitronate monooxygenase [Streptomyces sp. M7]